MRTERRKAQITVARNAMLEVVLFESVYVYYIGRSTIILFYRLFWLMYILRCRIALHFPRNVGEGDDIVFPTPINNSTSPATLTVLQREATGETSMLEELRVNTNGASRGESYGSTSTHIPQSRNGIGEGHPSQTTSDHVQDPLWHSPSPTLGQDLRGNLPSDHNVVEVRDLTQKVYREFSRRHSVIILLLALCLHVLLPVFMRGWHPFVDAPPTRDFSDLNSILGEYSERGWKRGMRGNLNLPVEQNPNTKSSNMFSSNYYYSKYFSLESAIMDFMTAAEATPRIPLLILLLDILVFLFQQICIELMFTKVPLR